MGATVLTAGPWLDDDGVMKGSLLIVDSESRESVQNWLSQDPYVIAGLTGKCIVRHYNWAIGAPTS